MKLVRYFVGACALSLLGATGAWADDCSGRDHTAGTVLGAAGGAAIGGAASHSAGGAIAGAVVGGLAGNAIARAQDCDRGSYRGDRGSYRGDQGSARGYYGPTYAVAPDEDRYWGVDSYDDFGTGYRHIQFSIDRARERGSLSPRDAERFSRRLQNIRYRADQDQRRGRFNPRAVQEQLMELREDMRSVRRENRTERATYDGRR